jgi:hypothetical protein
MSGRRARMLTGVLALGSLMLLCGAEKGGCGEGLDNRPGEPGIDVGGAEGAPWTITYSDVVTVKVKNAAGAVVTKTVSLAAGGVFDVEGVEVNLTDLCAREDVACPSEVFPKEVMMTQPGSKLHLLYVTYNPVGPLKELQEVTLLGNVDSDFDFSIALGIGAAAGGVCGLLGVSYATGHIASDGGDPPVGNHLEGEIVTAYSGGCVLIGTAGTAAAGVTVEIRIPFYGDRG